MLDSEDSQDSLERSVYITNLSFKTTDAELERIFSQAGKVETSHVFFDKNLLRPAGRGIVLFSKKEEAHRAIKEFDNITIKGRKIKVQINAKSTKLLNSKKGSVDEEDGIPMHHHLGFPGDREHESRRSSRHLPRSSRHHDLHHGHHSIPIGDYDDYDIDYHRIIYERDRGQNRDRIRERDRSRHDIGKYDYDPMDRDYDHSIKEIERNPPLSRLNEQFDDKKLPNPSQPIIIPPNIPVKPSMHGIDPSNDVIFDIGNDIPHSVWVKVIKKRSHDVYDELLSITKDHQMIKEKTLLRFQPNEAAAVTKFVDALSVTAK